MMRAYDAESMTLLPNKIVLPLVNVEVGRVAKQQSRSCAQKLARPTNRRRCFTKCGR